MTSQAPFHLSFPVFDLAATESWYVDGLGCRRGRRSATALVLGLGGHQLVAHLVPDQGPDQGPDPVLDCGAQALQPLQRGIYPRHFGLVFAEASAFEALEQRARQQQLRFGVDAKTRFPGELLEHRSFFLIDPSGNWLEFKWYAQPEAVIGLADLDRVGESSPDPAPPSTP
ncbi:glyoxalase [Synechococcus sp. ATX 2A4]|uniref:VOC family protein n=1 Tax=Synechococcus sp. ATX 2A4 TaxID=2823727 RepID=UPI0020CE5145|nr:VOC family protein [Synechococcus sp. ATX 2A4]MCP9885899.1 glyoxalase [Synechococcus sp. ATX 2A4]